MTNGSSDNEGEADVAVQVTVEGELQREQVDYARDRIASLERYSRSPLESARVTVRVGGASRTARTFYVADASVRVDGRLLAADAIGPDPRAATDAVHDRLRRQMRRVVDAEVARRNDPKVIDKALTAFQFEVHHRPEALLKPPEQREIVTVLQVSDEPETTLGAVAELLDRDYEFNLFRHARTAEDAVVHRREDVEDRRGKVLYLRHDGDYGLVEFE